MIWNKQVNRLQIDVTSYCNAACLACVRYDPIDDELAPGLTLHHMDDDIFDNLIYRDIPDYNIRHIIFNGNWGDCMMHPSIYNWIEKLYKEYPDFHIQISTNGSLRTESFWYKLGALLKGKKHHIEFCIDGLENTHSIYRVNTMYSKIIDNMKSFISGGGNAWWVMTAFEHNYEQKEKALEYAKELGCQNFNFRKSNSDVMENTDGSKVYRVKKNLSYGNTRIKNDIYWAEDLERDSPCKFYSQGDLQIDPWGTVWPCCWTSLLRFKKDKNDQVYPSKNLTLKDKTLREILSDSYFAEVIPNVVENKTSKICNKICLGC